MTLFKCLTCDNWADIMLDFSKTPPNCIENVDCGSSKIIINIKYFLKFLEMSYFYFISFMIVSNYLLMNVFLMVLLKQFEQYYNNPLDPLQFFKKNIDHFKDVWSKFSYESRKKTIHSKKLLDFFRNLGFPLGLFF